MGLRELRLGIRLRRANGGGALAYWAAMKLNPLATVWMRIVSPLSTSYA